MYPNLYTGEYGVYSYYRCSLMFVDSESTLFPFFSKLCFEYKSKLDKVLLQIWVYIIENANTYIKHIYFLLD